MASIAAPKIGAAVCIATPAAEVALLAAPPAAEVADAPPEEAAPPADEAPEDAALPADEAPEEAAEAPDAAVPLAPVATELATTAKVEPPEVMRLWPELNALAPVADAPPATPPMPKMVVSPVVVVYEEPDAETRAVRADVVIALLDSVLLPVADAVEVTVAVDAAPEPEALPEPEPVAVALERTVRALPVTEPLAVEEYWARALEQ